MQVSRVVLLVVALSFTAVTNVRAQVASGGAEQYPLRQFRFFIPSFSETNNLSHNQTQHAFDYQIGSNQF